MPKTNLLDVSVDIVEPLLCSLILQGKNTAYIAEQNIDMAARIAPVCKFFHSIVRKIPRTVDVRSKEHVLRLPAYFSNKCNSDTGTNKVVVKLKAGDLVCPCLYVRVVDELILFARGVNRLYLDSLEMSCSHISCLSKGLKNFHNLHVLSLSRWYPMPNHCLPRTHRQ